ncbi:hypothetical protein AKJ09_06760 [Labilithrix luteola]|uniref:Uncharacterized protein n=1 Tax=Labilithrix luteola TaxID=1391654 RepID=A0A0K1Q385_9BACT|nr:hypothetical protein AKJ09_06760 [Labilithrix luteola]
MAAVRTYTERWAHVPEGTTESRTIRVRISEASHETIGTLAVANKSGILAEREIVGPSCTEVSRALAVMVAVTIDPRAGGGGGAGSPGKAGASGPPEEASAPEGNPEARPPYESALPLPRATSPSAVRTSPPASTSPGVSLDVRVETTSAVIRGGLVGVGASITVESPESGQPRWLAVLKPSLGLGIRQSLPKERALQGGSVDLLWTAGHIRLCPLRISVTPIMKVVPCTEANIGTFRASAEGFVDVRRLSSFWFDVGASVWAAVDLSDRIFLSSTVLVTIPSVRQPLVLATGATVASVPPLGLLGGLGIGARM